MIRMGNSTRHVRVNDGKRHSFPASAYVIRCLEIIISLALDFFVSKNNTNYVSLYAHGKKLRSTFCSVETL